MHRNFVYPTFSQLFRFSTASAIRHNKAKNPTAKQNGIKRGYLGFESSEIDIANPNMLSIHSDPRLKKKAYAIMKRQNIAIFESFFIINSILPLRFACELQRRHKYYGKFKFLI